MMIPNLQIPHWDTTLSDGGAPFPFPIISNNELDTHTVAEDFDMPIHDVFSTDHFRMYQFKVRSCPRGRSHDWTECPYAHPAEKARRRDPRKYHYSGIPCHDFRKGNCNKGDSCHFAHGVFECWLHPSRYRTQLCKDRTNCRRKVCFFAHTPDQLRVLTHGLDESLSNGSPIRPNGSFVSSPTSVLNSSLLLSDSPPTSPGNTRYGGVPFNAVSVREIVSSMRNVQLDEVSSSGLTRGSQMGPRGWSLRPGFLSLEEEPAMERVESGRDLRARIYAKLSRENSIGGKDVGFSAPIPDIGWVSELVK